MTSLSGHGHGHGHVSNFYILDLENFTTPSRVCVGVINKLEVGCAQSFRAL